MESLSQERRRGSEAQFRGSWPREAFQCGRPLLLFFSKMCRVSETGVELLKVLKYVRLSIFRVSLKAEIRGARGDTREQEGHESCGALERKGAEEKPSPEKWVGDIQGCSVCLSGDSVGCLRLRRAELSYVVGSLD